MDTPIRILEIVTDMGRGGIETMLMNHYRKMDRDIVQMDFLTHRRDRAVYDDEIESLGGRIYRLPNLNPFSQTYLSQLDAFFDQHSEYKIVHCHLDCMSGIPLKVAKLHRVPVRIAHSHSSSQTKNLKYLLKLYYRHKIARQATHLFACGKKAGTWMFCGAPFTIMYNAIDAEAFQYNQDVRQSVRNILYPDTPNAFVMGHIGSFWSPKNHLFLLDIFHQVLNQEPNAKLLLIGTGGLMDTVRKKAEDLGIANAVKLLGDRSDISKLTQAMDVFVLPSLFEGLPVTMIEAQASGLPCFISDKVPLECKKTDLVTQLSLNTPPAEWAKQILKARDIPRRNTYSEIADSGFDVKKNAIWLQNFYLDQWKANT